MPKETRKFRKSKQRLAELGGRPAAGAVYFVGARGVWEFAGTTARLISRPIVDVRLVPGARGGGKTWAVKRALAERTAPSLDSAAFKAAYLGEWGMKPEWPPHVLTASNGETARCSGDPKSCEFCAREEIGRGGSRGC